MTNIDNRLAMLLDVHKNNEKKEESIKESFLKIEAHRKTLVSMLCNDDMSLHIPRGIVRSSPNKASLKFSEGAFIMICYPLQSITPHLVNVLNDEFIISKNIGYKAFRIFIRNFKSRHTRNYEIYTTTIFEENNKYYLLIVDSENNAYHSFSDFAMQFANFPFNLNSWLHYK